ncbi:MAG: class I SAM-dependent methyltransferase [Candidatus Firestonebacteria bacterium]|nr:class I SAM-dependent methyltransferase [Candidatus Firestonebacteria bacterium]
MRRTVCRGCASPDLAEFLNLGDMPLAGGFLSSPEAFAAEQRYPLPVHVCRKCGLVQILELVSPDVLFKDYAFSSSTINPLIRHFEQYAQWIKDKLHPGLVVEFGCNDGILLEPLNRLGIKTCGIDISENITTMARAKGLDVVTGYFDAPTAGAIRTRLGQADLVTGSNAFPHNDNPEVILQAARNVLKPTGHLALEVMYLGDLLDQLQWDTFYHEHLTFYCLTTLNTLLQRYGFHAVDAVRLPMHGGALRVLAAMDPDETPSPAVADLLQNESRAKLADPETWFAFGRNMGRTIEVVNRTLRDLSKTQRIWGYGAAGKATLWVNACRMDFLEAMVDASPLRAGKWMPGTHTPIVFPEKLKADPPDYIFITAWNYAEQIKKNEDWFKGIWITPLPALRFF